MPERSVVFVMGAPPAFSSPREIAKANAAMTRLRVWPYPPKSATHRKTLTLSLTSKLFQSWRVSSYSWCVSSYSWCFSSYSWCVSSYSWCFSSYSWCVSSYSWCVSSDSWCVTYLIFNYKVRSMEVLEFELKDSEGIYFRYK